MIHLGFRARGLTGSGWSTCLARTYMAGVLLLIRKRWSLPAESFTQRRISGNQLARAFPRGVGPGRWRAGGLDEASKYENRKMRYNEPLTRLSACA